MAVVYTGGKYCGSTFQFASNGATPLGCHFSSCNTKSGAVASFHNAILPLTVKLSVTVLVVTTLPLSIWFSTTKLLQPAILQSTLRFHAIEAEPVVSRVFK
jgi:hypothetical protein